MQYKITPEALAQRQHLPLEEKVLMSVRRIKEWVHHFGEENVSISFSGGKDSTVLLDLVRNEAGFPEIKAVFSDTGLEFPEIRDFVKTVPNVEWVKPKTNFTECIKTYGFPLVSKKVSHQIQQLRRLPPDGKTAILYMTGINSSGKASPSFKLSKKWHKLISADIKISDKCCFFLKKQPLAKHKNPIVGTMAAESKTRRASYLQRGGCNQFDGPSKISAPMSAWLEADVWEYIKTRKLPYSKIYDLGYERTGCMFCPFGLHLEKRPHRFDIMRKTHPQLFKYCMETLGFRNAITIAHGSEILEDMNKNQPELDWGCSDANP